MTGTVGAGGKKEKLVFSSTLLSFGAGEAETKSANSSALTAVGGAAEAMREHAPVEKCMGGEVSEAGGKGPAARPLFVLEGGGGCGNVVAAALVF